MILQSFHVEYKGTGGVVFAHMGSVQLVVSDVSYPEMKSTPDLSQTKPLPQPLWSI